MRSNSGLEIGWSFLLTKENELQVDGSQEQAYTIDINYGKGVRTLLTDRELDTSSASQQIAYKKGNPT